MFRIGIKKLHSFNPGDAVRHVRLGMSGVIAKESDIYVPKTITVVNNRKSISNPKHIVYVYWGASFYPSIEWNANVELATNDQKTSNFTDDSIEEFINEFDKALGKGEPLTAKMCDCSIKILMGEGCKCEGV